MSMLLSDCEDLEEANFRFLCKLYASGNYEGNND